MYDISEYDFELPKKLIAQKPLKTRSGSKLLTVSRSTGILKPENFTDIVKYFKKGDVLVINETKVMPARFFGSSERNGRKIEILILKEIEENLWEIMLKPGRSVKNGDRILLDDDTSCLIQKTTGFGNRTAVFDCRYNFFDFMEKFGKMPLPPYIEREETEEDIEAYQTVYAKTPGAVAAPTAGLHFTNELLNELSGKGVKIAKILLHVGAGTFRPVKTGSILDHKMHSEYYEVSGESADIINEGRSSGGKVFAVGTTAVRTIETVAGRKGLVKEGKGETDIFIYPGYKFKSTDHIITNFHLPKSTLLLLVSAFSSIDTIKNAYKAAVENNYRFYSYGDAMLIL